MQRKKLSEQIIETCLLMEAKGLNQGTSGNVSVRYETGMLITPTGVAYEHMNVDDIVFVDIDETFEERKSPSSEYKFHLACYKSRNDINAVVHNHAVNATAVSILNKNIPAVHYMVAATGKNYVPCVPYATFGTEELSMYVEQGIKESKAILLQHHGMIAAEVNLEKALWLAVEIETLAKMYLKLLSITDVPPVLSDEQMDKVVKKFDSYGLKSK
ncbi:MAG: L-fuculose-phosphate aldolase [Deltaproteobacteria bacterium]|nr:L-fuculose-phosphate aldolase [Deltaproteobacteria bacterium]